MPNYIYQSDAPLTPQKVTARAESRAAKLVAAFHNAQSALVAAQDAYNGLPDKATAATRQRAGNAVDAAIEAVRVASRKARASVKFVPTEGHKVFRMRVTDAVYAAWCAEPDADKRAAILADARAEAVATESPIHPSIESFEGYRAALLARVPEGTLPSAFSLSELAEGTLVLPTFGKGPSAKGAQKRATPEEVAAEMFADADASVTTSDETSDETPGDTDAG